MKVGFSVFSFQSFGGKGQQGVDSANIGGGCGGELVNEVWILPISRMGAEWSWSESVQYIIQKSAGDSNLFGHPSVDGMVLAKIPPQLAGQVRIPWILGTPIARVSSLPEPTWNPTLKSPSRGLPASVLLIGRFVGQSVNA
jgi:hypothetical protein